MALSDFAFGLDLSHHQGVVNFNTIAAHQPKVIFIAAKASEGSSYKDPQFTRNWAEMKRIGVGRIAYHYVRFEYSAAVQKDNLLSATTDWDWAHDRLALDFEQESSTASAITDLANTLMALLRTVTGRLPILYSRAEWVNRKMIVSRLPSNTEWWLAHYLRPLPEPQNTPEKTPPPALPYGVTKWLIHQTGDHCAPFGVQSAHLDYDRWNGDEQDVQAYFGYTEQPTPEPEPEPPAPEPEPTPEFPKTGIVIANPSVNIRKEASIQSADIGDFTKGTQLNIIGEQDDFWQVSAWVAKQWVRVDEPYQPPQGAMAIPPLSQRDPRWANDKMGNSTCTVGRFGCLITSITMALRWFGKDVDVKELNNWLSNEGGYVSGTGNLYWGAIPQLFQDVYMHTAINCVSIPAPLDKIDALLAQGIPAIVEVDFHPATAPVDQHWVLVIGKDGDDYIINDPWYGDTASFKERYGSPSRYIFWIRAYAKQ